MAVGAPGGREARLGGHPAGLRFLDIATDGAGAPMGVIRDRATYTAVLAVRPEAFALCDSAEQARRLAGWGAILAGVAREASPIVRLQWVERTAPADQSELIGAAQRHSRSPTITPWRRAIWISWPKRARRPSPTRRTWPCRSNASERRG